MSKALDERLRTAKNLLDRIDSALANVSGQLSPEVIDWFRHSTQFRLDVEYWLSMLDTRAASLQFLAELERNVDDEDCVVFGTSRIKFQSARLIGVQAYVSTSWALADRVSGLIGRVMCTPQAGLNLASRPQLVSHFIRVDKTTAGVLSKSIQGTFGWPIAISYAIRNHFVHDGAQFNGVDFFAGPSSAAGFRISELGWARIEEAASTCGVAVAHHRANDWPTVPRDDLRAVLRVCEREMDDALGVLLGSACGTLGSHLAHLLGEE